MKNNEFVLPDVGEGLTEAEIVSWAVKPGDELHLNQVICEIETAKSLVELPSPFEGVVAELLVDTGVTVPVGTPIMRMAGAGVEPAEDADASDVAPAEAPTAEASAAAAATDDEGSGAVLVGYGAAAPAKSRRRKGGEPPLNPLAPAPEATEQAAARGRAVATPPVRKLARDLGVDLGRVTGTGASGAVTRSDVLAAGERAASAGQHAGATESLAPAHRQAPASQAAREERIPVKGVRKVIAQAMVESKFSAPHTAVFVDVDATRTMEFVKRLKQSREYEGVRVSPLLIMAKAVVWAMQRNPEANVVWAGDEIIRRSYVNLGIAAATPRGLIVPNIRDAQDLSLRELAGALEALTSRARAGETQPAEMQHGTITITNVGVFGVDFGLPIINPGESAIMVMGSITEKPWVVDGEVRPRMVTTVGGSFDHRVFDGDVISRFVADVASVLEEPALLLG